MNEADVTTLLKDAAPMPEPQDFVELEKIVRRGRRRRVRHTVGRTAAGLAVVALVVAGALSVSRLHDPERPPLVQGTTPGSHMSSLPTPPPSGGVMPGAGRPLTALFDPSQALLPGGRVVTITEASVLVQYPLYLPQDSRLPAPEVWVVREIGEDGSPFFDAAVRYDSSVVITYGTWPAGRDPAAEYRKGATDWDAGYVTTIGGHPAWVVAAGSGNGPAT